jgi:hypothetical protein
MIQPMAKLAFVRRYCSPANGWKVFVDIDPSEEGRTGSPRVSDAARVRQELMKSQAPAAIAELRALGACVGQRQVGWKACFGKTLVLPKGDRDIIAVHPDRKLLWIAEVEGDSGGQPEGKIYKALGQLVCAVSEMNLPGFVRFMTLVAWGPGAAQHLRRAAAVAQLAISGLVIAERPDADVWLFGEPPSSHVPQNNALQLTSGRMAGRAPARS